MRYGLALSGGGARGAAHVGVLLALKENGLWPDSLAGTSAGSIVAGCIASGMSPEELKKEVEYLAECGKWYLDPDYLGMIRFIPQMLERKPASLKGFLKGNRLEKHLCKITQGRKLEEAAMGILIPAVDLYSGRPVVYTNLKGAKQLPREVSGEPVFWEEKGMLCAIMMASSSVPGIFCPRELNGRLLVDGGVTNNLPVNLMAAAGVKTIIAVDVGGQDKMTDRSSILDVVSRSLSIRSASLEMCHAQGELLTLNPHLPESTGLLDFSSMEEAVEIGYDYTVRRMPAIRRALTSEKS